jgi:hypothetical protein
MVGVISKATINQDALAEELLTKAEAMNPADFGTVQSLSRPDTGCQKPKSE